MQSPVQKRLLGPSGYGALFVWLLGLPAAVVCQSNIFQLLRYEPTRMASVKALPSGFELLAPQASSRILANPARAADYSRRFFYIHRERNGLSLSFLSNAWLVDFHSDIFKSDRQDRQSTIDTDVSPTRSEIFERDTFMDNLAENTDLRLSVANFHRTQYGASALGIFGMVRIQDNAQDRRTQSLRRARGRTGANESRSDAVSSTIDRSLNKQTGYLIGISTSFWGKNWDLTNRVSFGMPAEERRFKSMRRAESVTRLIRNGQEESRTESETVDDTESNIEQSPISLRISSFGQRKVGGSQYLLAQIDITRQISATIESDVAQEESQITRLNSEPPVSEQQRVDQRAMQKGKYNLSSLAIGYALAHQIDSKIYGFVGLKPEFRYLTFLNAIDDATQGSNSDPILVTERQKNISVMLTLPLYLNYAATPWLSFYGWLAMHYAWTDLEIRQQPTLSSPNSYLAEENRILYSDQQTLNVGMSLEHRSGLKAHVDFNTELDSVSRWEISLGYHF